MWLDVAVAVILAIFFAVGLWRGALAAGMSLAAIVIAYATAVIAAPRLGPVLAESLAVPGPAGLALAGTAGFVAGFLVVGIVSKILRRDDDGERSARDRFLGGVFGATRGLLVCALLAYLALWLDALRVTGTAEIVPPLEDSAAASATGSLVAAGVEAAMGEDSGPAGRLVARMAAKPGEAIADVQTVLEHPGINGLKDDPLFWTYVEHGAIDTALNRQSFMAITYDDELRHRLAGLGFISEEAAGDTRSFRVAAHEVLSDVGPRIRGLREDPELQALVEDPEVVAMLQTGDTLGLMTHSGIRRLAARIAAEQN